VQLVEAPCYKAKGRDFDSRLSLSGFSFTESSRLHCVLWVDSAFKGNENLGFFLGMKTAGA
jgi:hypothetical protein